MMSSLSDPGAGMNQASSGMPSAEGKETILVFHAVVAWPPENRRPSPFLEQLGILLDHWTESMRNLVGKVGSDVSDVVRHLGVVLAKVFRFVGHDTVLARGAVHAKRRARVHGSGAAVRPASCLTDLRLRDAKKRSFTWAMMIVGRYAPASRSFSVVRSVTRSGRSRQFQQGLAPNLSGHVDKNLVRGFQAEKLLFPLPGAFLQGGFSHPEKHRNILRPGSIFFGNAYRIWTKSWRIWRCLDALIAGLGGVGGCRTAG